MEFDILGTVMSLISLLFCMVLDHLSNITTLSGPNITSSCARCLSGQNKKGEKTKQIYCLEDLAYICKITTLHNTF